MHVSIELSQLFQYWLYFVAFVVVIVGLVVYFWSSPPEAENELIVGRPDYVNQGELADTERVAGLDAGGKIRG